MNEHAIPVLLLAGQFVTMDGLSTFLHNMAFSKNSVALMFIIVQACRPSLYRHVGNVVQLNWTASFRAVVRVRSHPSTYAYIGDSTVLGGGGAGGG